MDFVKKDARNGCINCNMFSIEGDDSIGVFSLF
jgi:hypothetical protein